MAGPVLPIGKNSSGSSSRHAERWRQSMAGVSFFPDSLASWGVGACLAPWVPRRAQRGHGRTNQPPRSSSVPRIGPLHKGIARSRGSQAPRLPNPTSPEPRLPAVRDPDPPRAPWSLLVAAGLVGLEGLFLAFTAVFEVLELHSGRV